MVQTGCLDSVATLAQWPEFGTPFPGHTYSPFQRDETELSNTIQHSNIDIPLWHPAIERILYPRSCSKTKTPRLFPVRGYKTEYVLSGIIMR